MERWMGGENKNVTFVTVQDLSDLVILRWWLFRVPPHPESHHIISKSRNAE